MVETVKGLAVPLPWGLLTLPQAWSPCFLKPAFPTGQDPDGAQLLRHLELRPRHIPPRASRPGPGRGPGRRARAVGASAPGMPLASQPGGVEGLPKPWDNCSNLLDSSDDQSWGVPHTTHRRCSDRGPTSWRASGGIRGLSRSESDCACAFLSPRAGQQQCWVELSGSPGSSSETWPEEGLRDVN